MEFLQMIDFTLVGLFICVLYEIVAKPFNTYYLALTGNLKGEDVGYSNCLMGLFYIVFIFAMLWNPILWLPALLLILLGLATGGATRPAAKRVKEYLAMGISETDLRVFTQRDVMRTYFTIDKLLSLAMLGWMIFLHLQMIGIIA